MEENDPQQVTYFAKADSRGQEKKFGIKNIDRLRHMYVIGKTGMGKSTLLENMAAQDIINGNGMAFIDPHGSAVETLLQYIPEDRIDDVIYFAPFDMEHPVSFNIMEDVGYDKRHLVVSGLMGAFKKIWKDQWSARMEYILGNTLMALIEYPDSTLLDVNTMLVDKVFRKKVVANIKDPIVKSFWEDEWTKMSDQYQRDATPAIQNKIGQFISNPIIRNIVGQPKASFSFREAMDNKKIIIMNLSKGRMGEQNADLIGSMLVVKIYLDAMSRADLPPDELKRANPFYFYVDEFQSFANDTFANILSEARKYQLSLIVAHQYIEQMPDEVRAAVFGNVGTMIMFRVGSIDADVLEKELSPTFVAEDIVNLGFAQIYLKLMIDGLSSSPFSAVTLPPLALPEISYVSQVIAASRNKYAKNREDVEKLIISHKEAGTAPEPKPKPKPTTKESDKKSSYSTNTRPQSDHPSSSQGDYPRPTFRSESEGRPPRRDTQFQSRSSAPQSEESSRPRPSSFRSEGVDRPRYDNQQQRETRSVPSRQQTTRPSYQEGRPISPRVERKSYTSPRSSSLQSEDVSRSTERQPRSEERESIPDEQKPLHKKPEYLNRPTQPPVKNHTPFKDAFAEVHTEEQSAPHPSSPRSSSGQVLRSEAVYKPHSSPQSSEAYARSLQRGVKEERPRSVMEKTQKPASLKNLNSYNKKESDQPSKNMGALRDVLSQALKDDSEEKKTIVPKPEIKETPKEVLKSVSPSPRSPIKKESPTRASPQPNKRDILTSRPPYKKTRSINS